MIRALCTVFVILVSEGALAQAPADASAQPRVQPAPVPRPSLADADTMLSAARATAQEIPIRLTCAVVDVRGDLVAVARMDGAPFWTVETALGKARASALFGRPSGQLTGPEQTSIAAASGVTIFAIQGALPVIVNGQRVGAIGCSGGRGEQDEAAASAGIAAAR